MIADKGYNADAIRDELLLNGFVPVIPSKTSRQTPIQSDHDAYREPNLIERTPDKPENWRRIVARCNKADLSFLSFVQIASAKL